MGLDLQTLSVRSSTILLGTADSGFPNTGALGVGLAALESRRWAAGGGAGVVTVGVGASDVLPRAAVSGRKSEAIITRWLLNELIVVHGDNKGKYRKY